MDVEKSPASLEKLSADTVKFGSLSYNGERNPSWLTLSSIPLPQPIRHRLENGLTLILHPIPITDTVTVDIWVRTGARHESPDQLGVSHFLEHMVFKGTDRFGPGVLDQVIEGRGGIANAVTGQDYTHYYITVAASDLAETFPYFAETLTQAIIPEDEFERERQVVLEEMRRAQDNPDYLVYHHLMETLYPDHPYGRPILGTVESLWDLDPQQMRAYHQRWYRPQEMTVVVVGGCDPDATLELVTRYLGQASDRSQSVARVLEPSHLSQWQATYPAEIHRVRSMQPRLEQARLLMAWPTVAARQWEEVCGLEVLASILGDGRTSRLVRLLREQRGWVRGVGSASMVQRDAGFFYVSAYLDPSYLEVVESSVLGEIQKLQTDLIDAETLTRVQRILLNEFIFSTESPGQLAGVLGYHDTLSHWSPRIPQDLELMHRYLEQIQSLTAAEIRELAQRYLPTDAYIGLTLVPEQLPHPSTQARLLATCS